MKTTIRNAVILFGSTLSVMAGAIVTPALPYITQNFSNIDNIEFLTKLILSLPPLFIAIFSPISGYLFEKFGRKPILIIAAILYGIAGTTGYYLNDIYFILVGRAFLGIAISALMTGFIVVLGDLFDGEKRNKFIGIQGAIMSFAGVIYLLLGGLLADINWNVPFITYAVSIIVGILLLFFLDETSHKTQTRQQVQFSISLKTSLIYLSAIFVMICYLMVPTQLPFLINYQFPNFPASKIGLLIAIWIMFSSLSSLFYPKIKNRVPFRYVYMIGFFIWGFGHLLIYFSSNLVMLVASLIFSGLGNGLVVPNLKSHILAHSTEYNRGINSGFLTTALYVGQFLSPIVVQPMFQYANISQIFPIFGILMFLISIVYIFTNKI
ncbi:MAG: MFS transporter [Ignavibacteria bacterium]|nr:MFS transporter [Ignavibacteria bacterium]